MIINALTDSKICTDENIYDFYDAKLLKRITRFFKYKKHNKFENTCCST